MYEKIYYQHSFHEDINDITAETRFIEDLRSDIMISLHPNLPLTMLVNMNHPNERMTYRDVAEA